jgi:hypothetical protein
MLTQMNSTLEEENKMLMEQMNKLVTQVRAVFAVLRNT